ncbi:MAG TPA: hypothetical protein PKC21_03920 [Oligoflexia bacterium]|nr:hypothetical protein [Oligoflexia bacterium]HMR24485.1 hypothetical protein [Oligoflexia bacterium]
MNTHLLKLKLILLSSILSITLISNIGYAQQEISLDMRDECVKLIRPFYGEAYKLFVSGTYRDNDLESLRGYYNHYLETYKKTDFSSLYSDVLQKLHEYTAKTHRLHYDISNFQNTDSRYYPLLDRTDYRKPDITGFKREEVTDDAESAHGEHALNLLCANRLNVEKIRVYSIKRENLEKYTSVKIKGGNRESNFLHKHSFDYMSSVYRLYHQAKTDLTAQKNELQSHVDYINKPEYQSYLEKNDIDLSGLLNFMNARISELTSAINELTELGY